MDFYFNLAYTWISGVSSLGLLIGKFCQFLTALSAHHMPLFSFLDINLSKCQSVFTKRGMCIDIVEIWLGIANGQISSIFVRYLPATHPYFCFLTITEYVSMDFHQTWYICLSIDNVKIWSWIANGQIFVKFWQLSACYRIMVGYYHFTFLFYFKDQFRNTGSCENFILGYLMRTSKSTVTNFTCDCTLTLKDAG